MAKRIFDIFFALFGVVFLLPLCLIIACGVFFTSKGGVFYIQQRVGKGGKFFSLFKFRTMSVGSDSKGLLTIGGNDSRVTFFGGFLRKYKLDELPQLINVLLGNMSFVGPRPEVEKYTKLYDLYQKRVLEVKPGITDYASLAFIDESDLLAKSTHPEKTYIKEIMPAKIRLNMRYIDEVSVLTDSKIILKTLIKIVSR